MCEKKCQTPTILENVFSSARYSSCVEYYSPRPVNRMNPKSSSIRIGLSRSQTQYKPVIRTQRCSKSTSCGSLPTIFEETDDESNE
mmetsp:Transcript_10817/g.19571  ORF Transcript_10817/g.19571 Transcript_10817/m.19571 type:complete len:86 (-) Transcript_10817:166-423(-)